MPHTAGYYSPSLATQPHGSHCQTGSVDCDV